MIRRELIETQGYGAVAFGLGEEERAAYTHAANAVISLALEEPRVADALTFNLLPQQSGAVRQAYYAVSSARNSVDTKVYLHIGYQSRGRVAAEIPEHRQPRELRELWGLTARVLWATERAAQQAFAEINEPALRDAIFPSKIADRNILLRVLRYYGARLRPAGEEVVTGHLDLGVATFHLFETHGNWFKAAACDGSLVRDDNSPKRQSAIAALRNRMRVIDFDKDREAAFFLGASYLRLNALYRNTENPMLPVCYHAGFRPELEDETVHGRASDADEDRLALLVFMSPSLPILKAGRFPTPTVTECRPQWR